MTKQQVSDIVHFVTGSVIFQYDEQFVSDIPNLPTNILSIPQFMTFHYILCISECEQVAIISMSSF